MSEKNKPNENTEGLEAYHRDQFIKRQWVLLRSAILLFTLIELAKYSNNMSEDRVATFIVNNPGWGGLLLLFAVAYMVPFLETKVYGNPSKALSSHFPLFWSYVFKGYYRDQMRQYFKSITDITSQIEEKKAALKKEGHKLAPELTQHLEDVGLMAASPGLYSSILEKPIVIAVAIIVFATSYLGAIELVTLPSSLPLIIAFLATYLLPPIAGSLLTKDEAMKGLTLSEFWRHAFHSDIELCIARLNAVRSNRAAILSALNDVG